MPHSFPPRLRRVLYLLLGVSTGVAGQAPEVLLRVTPPLSDAEIQQHCADTAVPDAVAGASRRLIEVNAQALGLTPNQLFQRNCERMHKADRDQRSRDFAAKLACELRQLAGFLEAAGTQHPALQKALTEMQASKQPTTINLSKTTEKLHSFTGQPPCIDPGAEPAAQQSAR